MQPGFLGDSEQAGCRPLQRHPDRPVICLAVNGGPPQRAFCSRGGELGVSLPSNFCAGSNCFGGPSITHSALQDQCPPLSSHAWAGATSSSGANAANSGWLGLCNSRFHVCTWVGYWGSVFGEAQICATACMHAYTLLELCSVPALVILY